MFEWIEREIRNKIIREIEDCIDYPEDDYERGLNRGMAIAVNIIRNKKKKWTRWNYVASKYNRVKGSIFETDVMKWLRKSGVLAERLTKAGSKDEGDMVVVIAGKSYILELKNRATLSLPEFWREAEVEALNYANARGIGEVPLHYVVVKRRNAGIDKAWVIQDLTQWLKEKE